MRGVSVIPKTTRVERMVENRQLFRLDKVHFDQISSLSDETGALRYLDPKGYIGFDIFDEVEDQPV
jgi:diketogulonate reductase-like aldo/keto reductase